VLLRLSQERRLRDLAVHNPVLRTMARRFVAGETLAEAVAAVRQINARGMTASLDHLGENVTSADEAKAAAQDYCVLLKEIARAGIACNASLKLTQLGLDLGEELAVDNLICVLEQARKDENFIRIDMESSEYVDRTLAIFYRVFEQYKNVGVVIQSCLHRSVDDVEQLIGAGARVRLVKGAYVEPPSVAFQDKREVDKTFVRLTQMLLERGNYPAIATHDTNMIDATRDFAQRRGISPDRYEFQMLYGIRRDLQMQLARNGHRMRVYVPYGTQWYPYLMRRMAERPANLMVLVGNVVREAAPGRR
jgi:proline dehydrogenase